MTLFEWVHTAAYVATGIVTLCGPARLPAGIVTLCLVLRVFLVGLRG